MIPKLYSYLSEDRVCGLCTATLDVDDQNVRLVRTVLGATAFIQVSDAPCFTNPNRDWDKPYFSGPDRVEVVLSLRMRRSHNDLYDLISSQYQIVSMMVSGIGLADWCFVGEARLGPVLGSNGIHWKYSYKLTQKLPYELWISVGGYAKWLLSIGEHEYLCSTADECMAIVQNQWGNCANDLQLTRYEGDSLLAVTQSDGKCVIFHYKEEEYDDTSTNVRYEGNADDKVLFYTSRGDEISANASWVVSKAAAIAILDKFITTGDPGEMRG